VTGLFELAMPWWEFVLRALVVYVALLVLVRLSGKRSVGQFTPFDMVLLILLGTAVQNSLIGKDISLLGGLLLAVTLIALNYAVGWLAARSRRFDKLVEGKPVQIIANGKLDKDALVREGVTEGDVMEALRHNGLDDLADVRSGWIEQDGDITIVPHRR
jgi:uncharacterized membrane protein YcaP (DUF421 family)